MTTPIWLTDEDSEISSYKRARIPLNPTQPNKSDCPSLVRAATSTVLGPATLPVTRKVGSAVYNSGWLTDPLDAPELTSAQWTLHAWAVQDSLLANVGLKFDINVYAPTGIGASVVSVTSTGPLGLSVLENQLVGSANAQSLKQGDRLLIKLSLTDVGGIMADAHTATLSYNGLYSRAEGDTYIESPDNLPLLGDIPDEDVTAIRTMLRDFSSQTGLSTSPSMDDKEIERYITQAVETYSVDRPYITGYYYSGDGSTFNWPFPPRWIWGFSRITAIEYPADQQIPGQLEYLDWEIRDGVVGLQPQRFLRLRSFIPDTGINNFFVQYSTRHQYSTLFSTIPKEDFDAVLWLGASYCATAIGTRFAGTSDSTIEADVVNYRDSQQKWASVARQLKEMYLNRVVSPDSATPVGSTQEWRPVLETGQPSLWHSRRVRRVLY